MVEVLILDLRQVSVCAENMHLGAFPRKVREMIILLSLLPLAESYFIRDKVNTAERCREELEQE